MQIYQITSPWTIKKKLVAATNLNALLTWSYEGGWRTRWLPSCPPSRHGEPGGSGAGRSFDSQTSGTPESCWDNLHSPKGNIRKFVWICTNCEFLIKNSLYKQHETTQVITHVNYIYILCIQERLHEYMPEWDFEHWWFWWACTDSPAVG